MSNSNKREKFPWSEPFRRRAKHADAVEGALACSVEPSRSTAIAKVAANSLVLCDDVRCLGACWSAYSGTGSTTLR